MAGDQLDSIVDGPTAGRRDLNHPDFAGIHFTRFHRLFQTYLETIWYQIFISIVPYPRIVGETGERDFFHRT